MTGMSQPAYVRRALVEPEPPPLPGGDAMTWTRARLFDGVFNTVLTIVSGVLIVVVVWPAVKFLLIDAVWTGTSRADCLPETVGREVGACWPFVRAKFAQFMYGFYPASEHWRVNLTYALGATLLVPLLVPRAPHKALNAILFFGAFPVVAFFLLALAVGVMMTLPIGGADMPVVISLYNALTGLAVAFEGYVLGNEALIIAGTMVGAAGTLLTQLMAKAMNRPISGVLFSNFGGGGQMQEIGGSQKPIEAGDVAAMMAYAERVVIVPGYGLAVAQAQHKVWELTQKLMDRGVKVKFAIHPVAGRMPGHMNVLLAEAGVPYDLITDMDDINPEFANTDVSLVIGANDVVNPVAKTDPASPIYGMPILDVVNSKNTIVIKRGKGTGFAGIENALFYQDNTRMLYGDGAAAIAQLVSELKAVDGGH